MVFILEGIYYFYQLAIGFCNISLYGFSISDLLKTSIAVSIVCIVLGHRTNILPSQDKLDYK